MEKKKPTKLPDGIAKGSETYGETCRPKGGRSESKALELRNRAAQRILMLMKKGSQADRLTRKIEPITDRQHLDYLQFQNKLAESPKIVQFAYWRARLDELRAELKALEESGNKRKIELSAPTIRIQIETVENTMRELFHEIKQERRVVSRTPNGKEKE